MLAGFQLDRLSITDRRGFILNLQICACAALLALAPLRLPAQIMPHAAPLEITHDKPFVMVSVNGKGPFRFVIDTGTGAQAFVTPALAGQLGLPTVGQAHLSDPSGQGVLSVPIVEMRTLRVAGVDFSNVRAVVHTLGAGDGYYEGLLGFALFRDYLLTLDFPRRQMTLTTGALRADGGRSVLPFRTPEGLPTVSLRIGGFTIDAQIDSGGEGLSLPETFASRLKYQSDPTTFANGQSLSTRFQIKAARLAKDVKLGRYMFRRPFVEISGAFPLANFGASPMQDFAVTFDQKNRLIRFASDKSIHTLGMTPTAIRLASAPNPQPQNPSLVPID